MSQKQDGLSRRGFVGMLSTLGAGLFGLAACGTVSNTPAVPAAGRSSADVSSGATTGSSAAPAMGGMASTAPTGGKMTADEMDKLHKEGVDNFVKGIKSPITFGIGGQPLQPRMEGDVKVFDLVCKQVKWEVEPGKWYEAWGYNGVVPGPEIRVTEGDKVRVIIKNELAESTAIHFHGQMPENKMDGVPYLTQDPIKPGTNFTYEFTAKPSGTHMYHSHHNSSIQTGMGLLGAFIVEPKDASKKPQVDKEYTMILNDGPLGYTINGKGFPATSPLTAKKGQKVLVRYINEGQLLHPMHLHGLPQLAIARDGWPLPQPFMCDTLTVAPGERWDVIIEASEAGLWAYHCHVLSHAESDHGMFGMVTVFIVE